MFFAPVSGGLKARLRVTPKAAADRIGGPRENGDGASALSVSVTAAPEGGKANAALIKLLAKVWRIPKTRMSVVAGASGRDKTLFIAGDADELSGRLRAWAGERVEEKSDG